MPSKFAPGTDAPPSVQTLDEAEQRGKQVLLYQPEGVLSGVFTCARCGAVAVQPDLLMHASECRYAPGADASITVW